MVKLEKQFINLVLLAIVLSLMPISNMYFLVLMQNSVNSTILFTIIGILLIIGIDILSKNTLIRTKSERH